MSMNPLKNPHTVDWHMANIRQEATRKGLHPLKVAYDYWCDYMHSQTGISCHATNVACAVYRQEQISKGSSTGADFGHSNRTQAALNVFVYELKAIEKG